jgi:hypothetical protein
LLCLDPGLLLKDTAASLIKLLRLVVFKIFLILIVIDLNLVLLLPNVVKRQLSRDNLRYHVPQLCRVRENVGVLGWEFLSIANLGLIVIANDDRDN